MIPTRVLFADDEPLVRLGIRQTLLKFADLVIARECDNGTQVVEALHCSGIDLALLDIHLPDLSGMDIVRTIGPAAMPPTIFITAYDQHAIEAFELNAVDYILKPFDEERLAEAIHRARRRIGERGAEAFAARLDALLKKDRREWAKRLCVRTGKGFDLIPVETIDWIEAADNYVQLHCGARTHLLGDTITSVQANLDPELFARVHRGHIVNLSRIKSIAPLINGSYELILEGGVRVTTGRQYRAIVQQLLGAASRH